MSSLAQTLDRIQARPEAPTGDYFYDKLQPQTDVDRAREAPVAGEVGRGHISCCERGNRAERELHWHFQHSAEELGERSAHAGLVYRIQVGGDEHGAALLVDPFLEVPTARLPSPRAIWASEREGRIRVSLKMLTSEEYGTLAMTFSLRKADPHILGLLPSADQHLEPIISHLIRTGRVTLRKDGKPEDFEQLVALAAKLLATALAAYEMAAGITVPKPAKQAPRSRVVGEMVSGGSQGLSKRKLVPVECPRDL